MEIGSPSLMTVLPTRISRLCRSIDSSAQPATHGRPRPRATTAACEVEPPRAV